MQQVNIIPTVNVIDIIVVIEFITSAVPWMWYVKVAYFGGCKIPLFYDPVISHPQLFGQDLNFATYTSNAITYYGNVDLIIHNFTTVD